MGLFSGIKKLGKKIFKGVKKVFKKVGKFVGKVMKSNIGKIVLTAAAVVTGGLALAAGVGAFTGQAAGATFLTKFVAGAKAFTGALLNPVGAGKGFFQGMGQGGLGGAMQGAASGQGIFNVGVSAPAVAPPAPGTSIAPGAESTAARASTAGLDQQVSEHLASVGGGGATGMTAATPQAAQVAAQQQAPGGFFSRVNEFVGSPTGQMVGGLIKGAAEARMADEEREDWQRHDTRVERAWSDPRQTRILEEASRGRARVPGGFAERSRRFNRSLDSRSVRPIELGPAYGG